MQDSPPDILITNYSMLSIMMMRKVDEPIFEKTKEWLKKDISHIFHLIIDELHLYRGTSGAEVAYLIRLFLYRIGLTPDSPQLRILASSASLDPEKEESLNFLKDFFGVEWKSEQIIKGEEQRNSSEVRLKYLPADPFKNYEKNKTINHLKRELSINEEEAVLSSIQTFIKKSFYSEPQRSISLSLDDFSKKIFNSENTLALKGLFQLLLDYSDNINLSFRFHLFFRNISGLWSCAEPICSNYNNGERTIGKLYLSDPPFLCENKHRIFEILYCEQCGTLFFGGIRMKEESDSGLELLHTTPNIEKIPDESITPIVEKRNYEEYAVFWPCQEEITSKAWNQPSLLSRAKNKCKAKWQKAHLNIKTGKVKFEHEEKEKL